MNTDNREMDLFADGDLHFQLARILKTHWLTSLGCSHEGEGSNAASCWCGWNGPRVRNVGECIDTWANHALEVMRPFLAAWGEASQLSGVVGERDRLREALVEARSVLARIENTGVPGTGASLAIVRIDAALSDKTGGQS